VSVVLKPGVHGLKAHSQTFLFVKKLGKISKHLGKEVAKSLILMKSYFLVIECINKCLLCHIENTLSIYKMNKLFLLTSCFTL